MFLILTFIENGNSATSNKWSNLFPGTSLNSLLLLRVSPLLLCVEGASASHIYNYCEVTPSHRPIRSYG